MRLILPMIILLSSVLSHAKDDPKFKARCRKNLNGSFHVEPFDQWQIVATAIDSKLSGVSIEKHDGLLPNAVPTNSGATAKMSGAWSLKRSNFWLACHHTNMKFVTVQKLPDGLKVCKATETSDAVEVECN